MYSTLFRHAIFPTLDRLNGTQIGRVLRVLEETEALSADDLRQLQVDKLQRLLDWTLDHSPFYRRIHERAEDNRRLPSRYAALDGLPIIGKPELRTAAGEFPVAAFGHRVRTVQTSGSTGAPTTFMRSDEQESWFWALRLRMWAWAGYRMGEPYMAINLNKRQAWKKRLQDVLFRCTYLTYNADNQDSARIVGLLHSRPVTHINAFGSTLLVLARYMLQHGVANPGVRVLTSTGDNLYPPQRQVIEQAFGTGVNDYYGAGGEGMHLASQCEVRDRYHVHMENSIVEIIKDGRPAEPGETGSIVVTQLDNRAMPLIRYDLGDLATVSDATPCPCGRAHELLRSIEGRACDMVHMPNGGVLLPQFFFIGAFKMLERVHRYQVVQDELERITIKLVEEPGCDRKRCETSLAREIAAASDDSLDVEFDWVDDIPLAGLGKPRAVLSSLDAVSLAGRATSGDNVRVK